MLRKETIERETLELLMQLHQEPMLKGFSLAGGTALALLLGHRKSIDLDLFTREEYNAGILRTLLEDKYGFELDFISPNTLKGYINSVAIDCITHNYNDLEPRIEYEGIRLYGYKDIAAMKLNAIADNGTRIKDFVDVAFLSTRLSLNDMLNCYIEKYPTSNVIRPLRALTYYDDIDFNVPVQLTNGRFNWEDISLRLENMIKYQDTIYITPPIEEEKNKRKGIKSKRR